MTQDHDATPPPPEDFREYVDARFGFSIHLPKRFKPSRPRSIRWHA